ncbi:ribonuclease Z [Geoalkalibacter sp.]|uniref:ribonuclease Z n=1 Tax=Geoalkalibacter sp. TaxID=3041440 RepID=UPI00272DEB31|nr:MBL fold metallo-hydrolase [Geoalkalibacter sp.]
MRSSFFVRLVNDPFGDPALYVRVAHRREALLFDCGDLHALPARDLLKIRAVFVSHAHIDHLAGFDHLLRTFLYRRQPLLVHGPPGLGERIGHRLAAYTWNLIDGYPLSIEVREWAADGAGQARCFRASRAFRPEAPRFFACPAGLLHETTHYRVRAVSLEHGDIPCLAFALEEKLHVAIHRDALDRLGYPPGPWLSRFKDLVRADAPQDTPVQVARHDGTMVVRHLGELTAEIAHCEAGMKIVYVTDASPSPANAEQILRLAADAHLLAIEACFAEADQHLAAERNHLTAGLAGALGRRAGAKKLLVFHHSPRYQAQPRRLQDQAQAAFRGAGES